jgi:hypothetical protein
MVRRQVAFMLVTVMKQQSKMAFMMRLKNAERWQRTLLRDIPTTMRDGQPINRYVNFYPFRIHMFYLAPLEGEI